MTTTELLGAADWPLLASALAAGAALGAAFFAALWWTVRRLPASPRPALWLLASLLVRFAVALAGFWWLVRLGGAPAGLAGALGFALARVAMARRIGPRPAAGETRP